MCSLVTLVILFVLSCIGFNVFSSFFNFMLNSTSFLYHTYTGNDSEQLVYTKVEPFNQTAKL